MFDFQRLRNAKTTFEMFSTISNVVSLMSYVSIAMCGTVFMMCVEGLTRKSENVHSPRWDFYAKGEKKFMLFYEMIHFIYMAYW